MIDYTAVITATALTLSHNICAETSIGHHCSLWQSLAVCDIMCVCVNWGDP